MSLRSFYDLITHTPVGGAFKCELIMAGRGDKITAIKSSAKTPQNAAAPGVPGVPNVPGLPGLYIMRAAAEQGGGGAPAGGRGEGVGVPPCRITFHGARQKNEPRAILAEPREIDRADIPGSRAIRNETRTGRAYTRTNAPRSAPGVKRRIMRANGADAPQAARAVCPCALEATPDPLAGPPGRTGPTPIGRNAARKSPHVFLADFGRETRPKATRHPARRTWARPGPRTSRFPLRLRPWEPTGSRPGARTAPADLRALQFSIACAERADRARPDRSTFAARRTADGRGERPLQHDISRA